jgi:hypothetical protein
MRCVRIGPVAVLEVTNTLMRALRDGLRSVYAVRDKPYTAVPLLGIGEGMRNEGAAELHFTTSASRRAAAYIYPHPATAYVRISPLGYANHQW